MVKFDNIQITTHIIICFAPMKWMSLVDCINLIFIDDGKAVMLRIRNSDIKLRSVIKIIFSQYVFKQGLAGCSGDTNHAFDQIIFDQRAERDM